MQNAKGLALVCVALLGITSLSFAGDVVFKVDMSVHMALGNFTPASQGVSAVGSHNGWGGADLAGFALSDADGDGVYEGTFNITEGGYNYKYVVTAGAPIAIAAWESSPDRPFTVTAGPDTLALSEWSLGVLFKVDMTPPLAGGATFDPATQYVAVVGNINGWGGAPRALSELKDDDANGVYEGRHPVKAGLPTIEYKFTIRNQLDDAVATWENHANRPLQVGLDPVQTELVKWDSDPGTVVNAVVLFQVDVSPLRDLGIFDETDGDSLVVYGSFNGWNGAALDQSLMRQSLLDPAIFELALPISRVPGSALNYKYFIKFNRNSARFANSRPPSGWEEPGSTGGGDRPFTFTDQTQQSAGVQVFQDIVTVVPKDSTFKIYLTADMRCALRTPGFGDVATDTLFLDIFDSFWHFFRGTLDQGDGESGPLIAFEDANHDSIYGLVLDYTGPIHNWMQYKLNWAGVQEANPGIALGRNRVRYARATGVDGNGNPLFDKVYEFGLDYFNQVTGTPLTVEAEDGPIINDPAPCSVTTSVEQTDATVPETYSIGQNYPNPFNPSTAFEYALRQSGRVIITLYNSLGQKVAELVNEEQAAGKYKVTVDFSNLSTAGLASGTYFYQMKAGDFNSTRRMMFVK